MAGMDDDVSEIGCSGNPQTPSPRTWLSNILNYGLGSKSFTDILGEDRNEELLPEPEKQKFDVSLKEEERDTGFQFSSGMEPSLFDANKPSSQVGFAERMAARPGFSTLKINTFPSHSEELNTSTSGVWSPYLTIPPGLSPTSLFDSPVFPSNMAQPSPTTGKLLSAPCHSADIVSNSAIPYGVKDQSLEVGPESFAFRAHLGVSSFHFPSADNKVALPSCHPVQERNEKGTASPFWNQYLQAGVSNSLDKEDVAQDAAPNLINVSDSFISSEQSPPLDGKQDEEADIVGTLFKQPDEDGYIWRKYGQKQVKGSEHPRSYYKCRYYNCQVKKKVERSLEGHITEIIYEGKHNHPKPPANLLSDGSEHPAQHTGIDGKPIWTSSQNSNERRDWKNDGLEASSASAPGEFGDPSANEPQFESSDAAVAVSSTLSNDEEDDEGTHGSASLGGDGEGNETESKRRKLDTSAMDMSAASRAVRESRVVLQTTSEVDILDDGYRWRKYGQKIVKGNPNPRSYYKCTNPGCAVRKHVERASHDLKAVITTYEGKHNHRVPAARGSGHSNTWLSTAASATVPLPQNLSRRPEPMQLQDNLLRFNVPAQLGPPPVNFAFRMAQPGLNDPLGVTGLSMVRAMNTPALTLLHTDMIHREQTEPGLMAPTRDTKEEGILEARLPTGNEGSLVDHQMMSRLPPGPQV